MLECFSRHLRYFFFNTLSFRIHYFIYLLKFTKAFLGFYYECKTMMKFQDYEDPLGFNHGIE